MKTKYCFIAHSGKIAPTDRVFCVWVGESARDLVKKALIESYAEDTGAFFRIWDGDTDMYLAHQTGSLVVGCEEFRFAYERLDLNVTQFYHSLVDGTLDMIEQPSHVAKNIFRMSAYLSPLFYQTHVGNLRKKTAQTVQRKNLSQKKQDECYSVAVGFCLILAIFLFSSWLNGVEAQLLGY